MVTGVDDVQVVGTVYRDSLRMREERGRNLHRGSAAVGSNFPHPTVLRAGDKDIVVAVDRDVGNRPSSGDLKNSVAVLAPSVHRNTRPDCGSATYTVMR